MLWLRRHGCNLFQGFYFARPMPEADFLAFARSGQTITSLFTTHARPSPAEPNSYARTA